MRMVIVAAAVMVAASVISADSHTSQSTVVKVNYNNIFLLLALKAVAVVVVLALSGGVGYGRALDGGNGFPWVSRDDLMFLTAFILSNEEQGHQCISRVACLHPALARQLATAAVILSPWENDWLGQVHTARNQLEQGILTHSLDSAACRQQHICPQLPYL
ncbi:uncharacterized protein LOC123499478 isoform X2 [Portunus trituberculatus]|nr:uncharacterized protein LOC123499478 isoform X2 [Portunus trituberculatus]XP_045103427.1 uncharacterized protein LOC123499478 isoform X2 [Portunus trituberculatus]XP_045103428.1 uncharacterized protein LOC123499478 isoform X2 [Portunus trituberculatus]